MVSTPVRHVRIPDVEWHALQAAAEAEGLTAAIVIRQAVRKYLASRDKDAADVQVIVGQVADAWQRTAPVRGEGRT